MTYYIKAELSWLKEHAEKGQDGSWYCKKTKGEIRIGETGRSIWEHPMTGGFGEVRRVTHLNCEGCNPDADLPRYDTPIYADELTEYYE